MNDEYEGLTPIETPDEMRERYARLEQETRASWSEAEQARQDEIDAWMINMPIINEYENTLLIESAKEHVKSLRNGSRSYGQPKDQIRMDSNWIHDYIDEHMKL
jgi:hypothetical protein